MRFTENHRCLCWAYECFSVSRTSSKIELRHSMYMYDVMSNDMCLSINKIKLKYMKSVHNTCCLFLALSEDLFTLSFRYFIFFFFVCMRCINVSLSCFVCSLYLYLYPMDIAYFSTTINVFFPRISSIKYLLIIHILLN